MHCISKHYKMKNAIYNSRNPITTLFEKKVNPVYELVMEKRIGSIPEFEFKVTVGSFCATGTGSSKKLAKRAAAQAMLNTLKTEQQLLEEQAALSKSAAVSSPVSCLFNLCVATELPVPQYTEAGGCGAPHERQFTVKCRVATMEEEGKAQTKKLAKVLAAKALLRRLQDATRRPILQAMSMQDKNNTRKVAGHEETRRDEKADSNKRSFPTARGNSLPARRVSLTEKKTTDPNDDSEGNMSSDAEEAALPQDDGTAFAKYIATRIKTSKVHSEKSQPQSEPLREEELQAAAECYQWLGRIRTPATQCPLRMTAANLHTVFTHYKCEVLEVVLDALQHENAFKDVAFSTLSSVCKHLNISFTHNRMPSVPGVSISIIKLATSPPMMAIGQGADLRAGQQAAAVHALRILAILSHDTSLE